MYLKSLVLRGFKTFADKTEIDLGTSGGIIAVVGPNGCGKSNILDSIRWVLGEQSLKEIRTSAMEEIIFAGTAERKPLSLAEVTLTIDNSDKLLPIEYSEIAIKRRVFRSGESEFFINKDACRLKDIRDMFMDTGLGKGSYSIINQGQVDAILSSKPEERRAPFEEAAQISKYRFRKEAAGRKLIATEQNLLRINDIKQELSQRIVVLEAQAAKAREYKEIKARLKELEIGLCKKGLESLNERKASQAGKIEKLKEELAAARAEFQKIEDDRQNTRQALRDKEADIEQAITNIEQKIAGIEQAKRDLEIERERERNLSGQLAHVAKEIEALKPQLEDYKNKLAQKKEAGETSRSSLSAKEAELAALREDVEGKLSRAEKLAKAIEDAKSSIFDKESQIAGEKNKLIEFGSGERFAKEEMARDERAISKIGHELAAVSEKLEATKAEEKKAEIHAGDIDASLSGAAKKRKDLEELAARQEEEISKAKEDFTTKNSRLSFLKGLIEEHQGFGEGVKETIKAAKKDPNRYGIVGIVADLIDVEEKYELAVEASLSQSLQLVITRTDQAAKNLIEHLRKENLGKATFLPLNILKRADKLLPGYFSGHRGFVGIASDLVKCGKDVREAIDYLLGRTIVFDNLDNALSFFKKEKLQKGERITTLTGELIAQNMITGGSPPKRSAAHLGRERELFALTEEVESLKSRIDDLAGKIQKEKAELKGAEAEFNELSQDKNDLLLKLAKIKHDKDSQLAASEAQREELSLLKEGISSRKTEIEDIGRAKEKTQSAVEALEKERSGLEQDLRRASLDSEQASTVKDEDSQKLTELRIEVSRLARDLKATDDETAILEENAVRIEETIGAKVGLDLPGRLEFSQAEVARLSEILPSLTKERQELEALLRQKKEEKTLLGSSIEDFERRVRETEEKERALRDKLAREEVVIAKVEAEMELVSKAVIEEYGIAIEEIVASSYEIPNQAKAKEEASRLKSDLKALGDVNLLAIEEFEKGKERLTFIETQFGDLTQARENLKSLIDELDKKARESFLETIRIVSENFSKIFADLFEGGEAKIMLIESDDVLDAGIEIVAKPYGKKWLSLELLSGGEKALTAIAILFALLRTHPSPFCFLDEVDAALDDANVIRFGKMLKNFSQETQIMVITHNKRTMSQAGILYGITMEEPGISKIVSMKLAEVS